MRRGKYAFGRPLTIIASLPLAARYLLQAGTGSGTGFAPALQFHIIEPHKQVNIAGIVSRVENLPVSCFRDT